ncbi:M3 family metallopeptidase [Kitasatospora arboriphila]
MANAEREAAELLAAARADGLTSIAAHDWAYYAERVRQSAYQVDAAELRPYLELERVLHDGVFFAAQLVYGVVLQERPELVAYHPDARVFEVFDGDGGSLGLFVGDFFARDSSAAAPG